MSRTTSDENSHSHHHQVNQMEHKMYTTLEQVKAETAYRQAKIAQDFRRASRGSRPRGRGEPEPRRHRWHLRLRHA